ncbi:MAG: SDR family oxidoreductase [Oceanococcaceae bacterium]
MQIDNSQPVLVTGANGYLASWIVKELLDAGCTVHATVRDPSNSKKVAHLQALAEQAPGTLKLFAADLLRDGSFEEAMQGCGVVLHTASPFVIRGIRDPQKELIDPAVQGTRNVLQSCNRVDSVQRVVLTSSVVSIYGDNADAKGRELTESDWNNTSSAKHQPYPASKVAAERAAWEVCKAQSRWDLVVINPGLVLGPSLTQASGSESLAIIGDLVKGKLRMGVPDLEMGLVDVRDVAQAHLRAAFLKDAKGRHILVSDSITMMGIADVIRAKHPGRFRLPTTLAPKLLVWLVGPLQGVSRKFVRLNVGHPLRFDNRKSREALGLEYRPVADTILEHLDQMLSDGLVRG